MPPRKPFRPDRNRSLHGAKRGDGEHGGDDRPPRGHSQKRGDRGASPGKAKFGSKFGSKPGFKSGKSGAKSAFTRDNPPADKPIRAQDRSGGRRRDEAPAPRGKNFSSENRNRQQSSESKENKETALHDSGVPRGMHKSGGAYWIYGHHAVLAAIDNPDRRIRRLVQAGAERSGERAALGGGDRPLPRWENIDRPALDRLAGRESVHQGVAAEVEPLAELEIEDLAALAAERPNAVVVILDQVTDPHNVGAILRSAAAFGALAVILTERHAAPETGVLAKAASGALDVTPLVRVANLARAMEQLKEAGFWCVGLAGEADKTLAQANLTGKIALCLGAEGPGLRRLTRTHCDLLAKLPTSGPIEHLNVSNAAAVALYELARG
jgi:23S rRNA (guanosine2251-2'-O)-methyltransferase